MSAFPIEDCTVKIKPTQALRNFIKTKVEATNDLPENIDQLKNSNKRNCDDCVLHVKDIKWLNEILIEYRKSTGEQVYLNKLLEKAEVILPPLIIVPRNPELDARVKKLMIQEKEREYASMTKNVDSIRKFYPEDTLAYQMKQINKQLIAVAQFVFSIMTGFAFGFIGIQLIVGNLDFGFRLLLGIIFALIVALAEIYFLAKKLNEDYTFETSSNSTKAKMHQD